MDCACPGAPPVCDCDDGDAGINPSAPELCDSPDVNCDGDPGGCSSCTQTGQGPSRGPPQQGWPAARLPRGVLLAAALLSRLYG